MGSIPISRGKPGKGSWVQKSVFRDHASVERALAIAGIERKSRYLDVEMLALSAHHAVGAGHEARRRLQRYSAGVFERFTGLKHRLLADHARAAHFLAAAGRVGDAPMAGLELDRLVA